MNRPSLSEEQKRLAGISTATYGGLSLSVVPGYSPGYTDIKRLEEGRSLSMFKGIKEMTAALERARKLVSRVTATVQHDREPHSGAMNEKSRSDLYRLDQELASAHDALGAAMEALQSVDRIRRETARESRRR